MSSPAMRAAVRLLGLHFGYSPEQIVNTPEIAAQASRWADVIATEGGPPIDRWADDGGAHA